MYQFIALDDAGAPHLETLDRGAINYYMANPEMRGGHPSGPDTMEYPKLWLICLRVQRTGQDPQWAVYAFSSKDQPGWPGFVHDVELAPTAETLAQMLADSGHTVYLRRYENFAQSLDSATIPVP